LCIFASRTVLHTQEVDDRLEGCCATGCDKHLVQGLIPWFQDLGRVEYFTRPNAVMPVYANNLGIASQQFFENIDGQFMATCLLVRRTLSAKDCADLAHLYAIGRYGQDLSRDHSYPTWHL